MALDVLGQILGDDFRGCGRPQRESTVRPEDGIQSQIGTVEMIEKIEEVVAMQVEAIKNLKIVKITVWDSAGGSGAGSSTANFASSLIKSLPPLHEVARMAGIELPEYLGKMVDQQEPDPHKPPPVPPPPPNKH